MNWFSATPSGMLWTLAAVWILKTLGVAGQSRARPPSPHSLQLLILQFPGRNIAMSLAAWLKSLGRLGVLDHSPLRQCSTRLDTALAASFSASLRVAYEFGERMWIWMPSQTVQRYRNSRNGSAITLKVNGCFSPMNGCTAIMLIWGWSGQIASGTLGRQPQSNWPTNPWGYRRARRAYSFRPPLR